MSSPKSIGTINIGDLNRSLIVNNNNTEPISDGVSVVSSSTECTTPSRMHHGTQQSLTNTKPLITNTKNAISPKKGYAPNRRQRADSASSVIEPHEGISRTNATQFDNDGGLYILESLEKNPILQELLHRRGNKTYDQELCFQWTPLISRPNAIYIGKRLHFLLQFFLDNLTKISFYIKTNSFPSIAQGIASILIHQLELFRTKAALYHSITFVLLTILPITALICAVISAAVAFLGMKLAIFLLRYLTTIVVDVNDAEITFNAIVPRRLKSIGLWCVSIPSKIDSLLFLGNRYKGREWNSDDYVWYVHDKENTFVWKLNGHKDISIPNSCNYASTLYDNPPPAISSLLENNKNVRSHPSASQQRRLLSSVDLNFIKSKWSAWSKSSVTHVAAIDFCYVMLYEEEINKRFSRKKSRRANKKLQLEQIDSVSMIEEATIREVGNNSSKELEEHLRDCRLSKPHQIRYKNSLDNMTALDSRKRTKREGITVISSDQTDNLNDCIHNFHLASNPCVDESIEMKVRVDEDLEQSSLLLPFDDNETDSFFEKMNMSSEICFSDDEYMSGREEFEIKSISSLASDTDMPWLDVGVKVGKLLLNSAHVQRAMASQETTDRLLGIGANFGGRGKFGSQLTEVSSTVNSEITRSDGAATKITAALSETRLSSASERHISKPIHPIWTSPAGVGPEMVPSRYSLENDDTFSLTDQTLSPQQATVRDLPPLSPRPPADATKQGSRYTIQSNQGLECSYGPKATAHVDMTVTTGDYLSEASSIEVSFSENLASPFLSKTPTISEDDPTCLEKPAYSLEGQSETINQILRVSKSTPKKVSSRSHRYRRSPLKPGIKIAVPLYPWNPNSKSRSTRSTHVMASVVSSKRIYVADDDESPISPMETNCLSVTAKLEQFFLRQGEFADVTFRIMDDWPPRYMPRHSKVPVGSCVATIFGIGVLVGWRVEDDCHVVRSLWQRRGPGTAHAYLNRNAIISTIEAAVGFTVETTLGYGEVLGCHQVGSSFLNCKFSVAIKDDGQYKNKVVQIGRQEILSCLGAQFVPVTEHLIEAVNYQLQIDKYYASVRGQRLNNEVDLPVEHEFKMRWTEWAEIIWSSFLKAAEEDKDFDSSINELVNSVLDFLEKLDKPPTEEQGPKMQETDHETISSPSKLQQNLPTSEPGFWIMNDLFGGIFTAKLEPSEEKVTQQEDRSVDTERNKLNTSKFYDRAYGFLRLMMKTFSIARAASVNHPHLRLALAIGYDFLLFLRTVINVQQRNLSANSVDEWKRAWGEIMSTFGPLKDRLEKIGKGFAQRMKDQGRRAKIRLLKFTDKILSDERLLVALELGDWDGCLARLEIALVEANVIETANLMHYRKTAKFLYDHIHLLLASKRGAASRNTEKLALFAKLVQTMASPRRSLFKFLCHDSVLELFERILVRAYYKEDVATRMLTIHAANFHTLRHLRMLKYFPISGRIWIPLLDAADEEFSYLVSKLPENSKEYMAPLSNLFTLCVVQFHKINAGDYSRDWLSFLLEKEAAAIIHDIDMKLLLSLESFSRDVREMMEALPYYSSIDDDILNLIDEVDLDQILKEASDALDDPELLAQFIREKATVAIERFLNYLPKLSIPVEKRELGDGWVLTCRGEDGGDLTLSDVNIKRENLVCQVMGGDTLFFPLFNDDDADSVSDHTLSSAIDSGDIHVEESVLDQIKELIMNATKFGCYKPGSGGVKQPSNDLYVSAALSGLPISSVLNSAIELWRNLELDDDELLEIAIRDVSYQIQLEKERDEGRAPPEITPQLTCDGSWNDGISSTSSFGSNSSKLQLSRSSEYVRHRFNPRVDPSVLYLEIKNLNLNLLNFLFRIEKNEKKTLFDPVFEGKGMVSLENVSVRLRIECAKERFLEPAPNVEVSRPVLVLQELDVVLEKLRMKVKDTGFGSDWVLNKAVDVFEESITKVVEENLREQINTQVKVALESLNSYFATNPNILLSVLGISLDDLDANVIWI